MADDRKAMRIGQHARDSRRPAREPPFCGSRSVRLVTTGGRLRWLAAPAVFDLNGPAHYVHWHFFQMSVANIVVILLMIAVFVAAILLPFPHRGRRP